MNADTDHARRLELTSPIEDAPGVGPRRGEAFRRLGVPSVAHLIHRLPTRHEYEEAESDIAGLAAGANVSVRGEITATRPVTYGRKRFEAVMTDASGRLDLIWFNQPYLAKKIIPGMRLLVEGRARMVNGGLQLANPRWKVLPDGPDAPEPGKRERRLRPVYPASEELPSTAIEEAVGRILDPVLPLIEDHLPEEHRDKRGLPSLADAYRMMHRPVNESEVAVATRRLIYDELLLLQLGVHMKRAHLRRTMRAPALRWNESIDEHIRSRFPFTLTDGQEEVIRQIVRDLQIDAPANRLIQGDVGAGKTVVALYAMLMAVASDCQAAIMAPTELLAEQHAMSIRRMLDGSNVRLELLTGSVSAAERDRILRGLASGDVDLVIGTHALLTEDVRFNALAVTVIDEQHRFGVHQRARLRAKAGDDHATPHVLVMTATPIPRTLSLTVFGDLDVSTIRGLPPGRQPVRTEIHPSSDAAIAYDEVRRRIDAGEQAYVIVPAIEDGAASGLRDVATMMRYLEEGPLAGKRLAALHGRLKPATRERRMEKFRAGRIDALIATTVIEVGVDVPNATMIVIEHAERFGLAQLHQLRGRVGRGEKASLCTLIADPATQDASDRLAVMVRTNDGFELAEEDLRIRGPGELIGARQSGQAPFRLAEFPRDIELLMLARRDAAAWIEDSPALGRHDERLLRRRLFKAHGDALGLADVA